MCIREIEIFGLISLTCHFITLLYLYIEGYSSYVSCANGHVSVDQIKIYFFVDIYDNQPIQSLHTNAKMPSGIG